MTTDYHVIEHMENVAISGDVPGMTTFVYAVFTRFLGGFFVDYLGLFMYFFV